MVPTTGLDGGVGSTGDSPIFGSITKVKRNTLGIFFPKYSPQHSFFRTNYYYLTKPNPTPLNPVMVVDTVTPSLDDHEEVLFFADNVFVSVSLTLPRTNTQDKDPPPTPQDEDSPPDPSLRPSPPSSPPATITANIVPERSIVSGTSSDALSVLSRASRDPDGNRATIAVGSATPSTHSKEPTGSIAGTIERQVDRQHQQIDAAFQELCPLRPDPLIATESSSMILVWQILLCHLCLLLYSLPFLLWTLRCPLNGKGNCYCWT